MVQRRQPPRAEALLGDGAADPALAQRVRGLMRELAEEQADVAFLESLDAMRLRQADIKDDHFVLKYSRTEYEQALRAYGLHRNAMPPEQAARAVSRRPVQFLAGPGGFAPRCWRPWTTGRSWRVSKKPQRQPG